jgi:hypothetical protein
VLWTSHEQAIIVLITDGVEEILHVESKRPGGVAKKMPNRRSEHYRKVVRAIQDAQEIFILGSAQARLELKSQILKIGALSEKVGGSETEDTMTENQVVARAREICGS